ncbi:hypothetical protein ACLBXO_00040 [Methylobacterium sp. C33D]
MDADTSETFNAGPYQAYRAEDGKIDIYDSDEHLFALPAGFPAEFVRTVAKAMDTAYERGRVSGQVSKAYEIRQALMML